MNVAADGEARSIVIAHRGASGYLLEHTLMAYAMATAVSRRASKSDPRVTRSPDPPELFCLDIVATKSRG
ncbi:MAG: hypothetical protein ACREVJ_15560 [Gammaproteobacteria bacterium]